MPPKSSAHYQREYRKRLREQGLVKKEVWVLPEHARQLSLFEQQLRQPILSVSPYTKSTGESLMTAVSSRWTAQNLWEALSSSSLCSRRCASVELIDGVAPTLLVVMLEYGDLPVFVSVSGEQILVESLLWAANEVRDIAQFNEAILRTHKYFPLSTISLDKVDGEDFYHMFGALSAFSSLDNIIMEIETLASNVIQATQAYVEFLPAHVE